MDNKRGIFLTAIIVIVLSALNVLFFLNDSNLAFNGMTGKFIEDIPKLPGGSSLSTIAFVINWIVIIIIILIAISKHMKNTKEDKLQINYENIKNKKSRSETDLDILYNLLKDKKKLRIGLISKTFKIDKEKALEWGKILENYDLARIEYPTFSEPEIRLYDKEIELKKLEEHKSIKNQEVIQNEKENKTSKETQKVLKKKRSKKKRR